MKEPKYKNYQNQYFYQEQMKDNHNAINYEKNLIRAKKLYSANCNPKENYKSKPYKNVYNQYNPSKNRNMQFKQILNSYMNDYEKLKRQNKIPKIPKNEFNFQEYENKKKKCKRNI